jgi:hypothetical protein
MKRIMANTIRPGAVTAAVRLMGSVAHRVDDPSSGSNDHE